MTVRSTEKIIQGVSTVEGEGFLVHRPFPSATLSHFDPFLLLDEMGPVDVEPGMAKGAPDHPHRGFETVTYLLSGGFQHKDSTGREGKLNAGDVQWMTAGGGVIHSELPSAEFQKTGGRLHGLQLWVNLPRIDKMMAPRYQEIPSAKIPAAETADSRVTVRVLAGEALGVRAIIDTRTPILYLDFNLQPGAEILQPVPKSYNAFAYVLSGSGLFGTYGNRVDRGQMAPFAHDGDAVLLRATQDTNTPCRLVLIAGQLWESPSRGTDRSS
jgi:quercetin 2,3-dioxygenase